MDDLKEICCLCLSDSHPPFYNLLSDDGENSTHFFKLSSSLLELSKVVKNSGCHCQVCSQCCDTIQTIYNFNRTCLNNFRIYSSKKNENSPNLMDICQVHIEIEDTEVNRQCPDQNDNSSEGEENLIHHFLEKTGNETKRNEKNKETESIELVKKGHECDVCKKKFSQKYDLKRHEMIHNGDKPYMCDICGKSFNRQKHLNDHILLHTGEKPYVCDICNKKFRHKNALNRHKLIHFGEKPYSCDMCDKQFSQNIVLIKHKRTHTGEKPYSCNVCGKSFAQKVTLVGHRSVHTGEKPFACEICLKSFTQKSTLSKHRKKMHKT